MKSKIYRRVTISPSDWMKVYEKQKGELVFSEEPSFRVGQNIALVAFNSSTKRELSNLPRLTRSVVGILREGFEYIVKIVEE